MEDTTTYAQYELIITYLEFHENLLLCTEPVDHMQLIRIQQKWLELVIYLNSGIIGPIKSLEEWKTVIGKWTTNIKRKASYIKDSQENGTENTNSLSVVEERLMRLFSKRSCDSVQDNSKQMPHNNTSTCFYSDLCEVVLNEETPSKNKQENGPSKKKQENGSRPKKNSLSIISARRRKIRRQREIIKTLKDHTAASETLARSNNQLTDAIKSFANAFNKVSGSTDTVLNRLSK